MKAIKMFFTLFAAVVLVSFADGPGEPVAGRTLNMIYVQHTKSDKNPVTGEGIAMISKRLDSIKNDKNAALIFFLSNSFQPVITRNAASAEKTTQRLYDSYFAEPSTLIDKGFIRDQLATENLAGIDAINFYFFVGEDFLKNDLAGDKAGIMLNFLPKELQQWVNCKDDKIHVYLYYPATMTALPKDFNTLAGFDGGQKSMRSAIKFHFQPI